MKNLTLIDTIWKQSITLTLTDEENVMMFADPTEENLPYKHILMEYIRSDSLIDVSIEDATQAQSIYDANKLKNSTLISVDIVLPDGNGIINCRVGNEHVQIRF